MNVTKILKIASLFATHIQKTSQEAEPDYNQIIGELNSLVQGFITRNHLKMVTTKRPLVRKTVVGNQYPSVSIGFYISEMDYNNFIRKLNNEVQKLQQKYPDVKLFAYYDTRDARRAKI